MVPAPSFDAYAARIERWVARAEADLIVFPEYGAMELAAIDGAAGDLAASIQAVAGWRAAADALHRDLAQRYGAHILAASGPELHAGAPVNRARFYAPTGAAGHQDKQIMTRFERELWGIGPGDPLTVFDTALGTIAVLICYDAEFPLLARAAVEAGAELILVPSCTDTLQGYNRVRLSCAARALEGQCIVVQSATVGDCDWCPAVDENRGAAAIFAPPDGPFPDTGVIAQGALDAPGWVRAEVDLAQLAEVREGGAQLNFQHWSEQTGRVTQLHRCSLR